MLDALWDRFRQHDRQALAKLLSLVARGESTGRPLPPTKPGRVVAVTGGPGVGKSTLIGQLITHLRGQGKTVAVLACDPQSPLSGGALLGDRIRMAGPQDDGVFIRSLAAPGHQGAVAERLDALVGLVESFGFDVVIVETVGAGQGDTAARASADVVVLLLQPESGDDLQWEKAGVLEIADVIAVHKADLPGAEQTAAQVRATIDVGRPRNVPVLRVSSKTHMGIAELWRAIEACPLRRRTAAADDELLRLLQHELAERFIHAEHVRQTEWLRAVDDWRRGDAAALGRLLELLSRREAK